jgi:hypothetical protein
MKFAVMKFINYKDRWFCITKDIKYQKVILFITKEYVSLKSITGFYVKPCATSLTLYCTTPLFSLFFQTNIHLNLTGITSVNTFLFLSELSSTSISSFHLFLSDRILHFVMVLGSRLARTFSAIMVEKHELTIIVLQSYTSPELV